MRAALAHARPGAAVLAAALTLGACGSSTSSSSTTKSTGGNSAALALSITESGKTASFSGPTSIGGGLVQLSLHNGGKMPHAAQLIRLDPPHTVAQALQVLGSNSAKTPNWIHFEGGLGPVAPGATANAILNLDAGKYAVGDVGGPGGPSGPPAVMDITVNGGTKAALASSPVTVTAANPGKDKYKWQISGTLHAGPNTVTFDSKGSSGVHVIAAARITGNPSKAKLIKALASNGPPPAFVDQQAFSTTAAIDGGKSQVTPLPLLKPGEYVLFCPLTDRDGGKPHFEEGLLTTITVK